MDGKESLKERDGLLSWRVATVSISKDDLSNLHLIKDQFVFRKKILTDMLGWATYTYEGMELDHYDTPATTYFVANDVHTSEVLGTLRCFPTDNSYLTKDFFSYLLVDPSVLPEGPDIFESSRLVVCPTVSKAVRRAIVKDLVSSQADFGRHKGVSRFVGVMPPKLWKSAFDVNGQNSKRVGKHVTGAKWEIREFPTELDC